MNIRRILLVFIIGMWVAACARTLGSAFLKDSDALLDTTCASVPKTVPWVTLR